jgi:hypothetical protein
MTTIVFHVQDAAGLPIGGAFLDATSVHGPWQALTNPCGDFVTPQPGLTPGHYAITISAPGFADRLLPADLQDSGVITIGLERDASWTPERLRAIRGAIWPTRGPMPFGPRPGQADNIIDTGCEAYSQAELAIARGILNSRKYTHVQIGPFIDGGYHGQFPAVDFRTNPDEVLALIESWWNAGFAVLAFLGPDGWTTEQMRTLEPIFTQPRWQAALKQIVPMGWEPSKDTPNAEFVKRYQWAKRVFPTAQQYIHLNADFDAPGNNDDLTPSSPTFIGMGQCWSRVAPYLTGFLIQNGPYGTFPHDDPTLAQNFGDQFRAGVSGSLRDHFVNGRAGWPTTCAHGGTLDLIAAEQTSYRAYWNNLPEDASRAWGQVAMAAGADGFFDGGNP